MNKMITIPMGVKIIDEIRIQGELVRCELMAGIVNWLVSKVEWPAPSNRLVEFVVAAACLAWATCMGGW